MEETERKPDLLDVEMAITKLEYLNELFFDSVMHNNSGYYCKYKYVTREMSNYISVLTEYFGIDFKR